MTKIKTTPWRELRAACNFTPDDEARIAARQAEMAAEEAAYSLAELRKQRQATQAQLADVLGIDETTLSRREHSTDPRLSTVREQIEALGGRLELVANFDGDRIPIDL